MAAGSTYTPIATTTLGSAQSSYTFSSISGYTDIVLVADVKVTANTVISLRVNGDTGNSYSRTYVFGATGSSSGQSARDSNSSSISTGYWGASNGNRILIRANFMNYLNTSTFKTLLVRQDNPKGLSDGSNDTVAQVGLWRNTAAINSITIFPSAGNLDASTTLTLYGIQAA